MKEIKCTCKSELCFDENCDCPLHYATYKEYLRNRKEPECVKPGEYEKFEDEMQGSGDFVKFDSSPCWLETPSRQPDSD